jgi:hypothetical protein
MAAAIALRDSTLRRQRGARGVNDSAIEMATPPRVKIGELLNSGSVSRNAAKLYALIL